MPTKVQDKTWCSFCFVCQELEVRQGTAHFAWAARQLQEDNFYVLFIYVGFKPVIVGTWRYPGITQHSESRSCWRYGSMWYLVLSVGQTIPEGH